MIKYKNIRWHVYHGALIPKSSPHTEINLTEKEAKEVLLASKALLIRYTNEWDRPSGSFWYLIKDNFGGFEELSSKYRTQIRRGLKNCNIKRVSKEEIAENGYDVYRSAFEKYNTNIIPVTEEAFKKGILNSDYDNWAVYTKKDNKLIAYSQNTIQDDICNSTTTKFNPEYLRLRPSEALFFQINKYYLYEKNYLYVNNGTRSILHDTNIQDFLEQKLKFRKAYCRLNIYYRKDIKLVVNTLYPFRHLIRKINHKFAFRLSALLKQEEIRRSYN